MGAEPLLHASFSGTLPVSLPAATQVCCVSSGACRTPTTFHLLIDLSHVLWIPLGEIAYTQGPGLDLHAEQ